MELRLLSLVPDAPLPQRAPASTRPAVPPGYGVQEQCLPFTAACALGLLVPAPFDFGLCLPAEFPAGVQGFRAPGPRDTATEDQRLLYVRDRPSSRFRANAYSFDPLPFDDERGERAELRPVQPGLSFFERADQAGLFKLHLPWLLRTPDGIDSLYGPPLNRPAPLELLSGLIESDWYAHPVNLVVRRPATGALHISAGQIIAQVLFVARDSRRAEAPALPADSAVAQTLRNDLLRWFVAHRQDRSAYRRLVRSKQGRLDLAKD